MSTPQDPKNPKQRFERRRGLGLDRKVFDDALYVIDAISRNLPISTTLRELQLVVERLTFSKLYERQPQNDPATIAELDLFFRDEVSDGMLQFVRWIASRNLLGFIAGDQGKVFLDQCLAKYRRVQEIQVTTAIPLTKADRAAITERLRPIHPVPARILFNTSQTMIAGLVVDTGSSIVD